MISSRVIKLKLFIIPFSTKLSKFSICISENIGKIIFKFLDSPRSSIYVVSALDKSSFVEFIQ